MLDHDIHIQKEMLRLQTANGNRRGGISNWSGDLWVRKFMDFHMILAVDQADHRYWRPSLTVVGGFRLQSTVSIGLLDGVWTLGLRFFLR